MPTSPPPSSVDLPTAAPRQREVADWFDTTYATQGLRYLRGPAAYPIYLQMTEAQPAERLLDVACGAGMLLRAADARGLVPTGIDLAPAGLSLAQRQVPTARLARANSQFLPFADGSFDVITCIGSIERFLDRRAALTEFLRVAKPGARFCFMVRNSKTLTWRIWRQWLGRQNTQGHQDALTLEEWQALFESLGFAIDDVLPDQWMRQRLRYVLRGMRHVDPQSKERVARGVLPLRWANEFIFVMRKART